MPGAPCRKTGDSGTLHVGSGTPPPAGCPLPGSGRIRGRAAPAGGARRPLAARGAARPLVRGARRGLRRGAARGTDGGRARAPRLGRGAGPPV